MRRVTCLLLAALICLVFFACSTNVQTVKKPANFYYCNQIISYNAESAVIAAEIRESADWSGDLQEILNLYFTGPTSDKLTSPFPDGARVAQWELVNGNLRLTLSSLFTECKGIDLTLCCACLSKTVMEIVECSSVEILPEESELQNLPPVRMDQQALLLIDQSFTS